VVVVVLLERPLQMVLFELILLLYLWICLLEFEMKREQHSMERWQQLFVHRLVEMFL